MTAEHVVRRIAAQRAHVDERGAAGAGGGDRAAIRGAVPPGAKARRMPKGWCDRRYVFVQQRRFAADSSFGMCQERVTAALSANGSNRPKRPFRARKGGISPTLAALIPPRREQVA